MFYFAKFCEIMPKLKSIVKQEDTDSDDGPSVPKRSRKQYNNSISAVKSPIKFCKLPAEVLEKIIGNINIWHHNRIRATCKRLKSISDIFIMHEFRKALLNHSRLNPCSYQSAVLRTIELATGAYARSGFETLFCGCILPMLRSSYREPFCPQQQQIQMFILHFFTMVQNNIGDSTSPRFRLLYNVTLLRFLKAFNTSTIMTSLSLPLHWRTIVELRGPWFGMLWKSTPNPSSQHNHLFVILSELLIANITQKAFKTVWGCGSAVYVYGNDTSREKRVPRTIFTITVHGSKKISMLLAKCLDEDPAQFAWPEKWPNDQFTVNVDINCKEAVKWGCSKSQHLEFSPFIKQSFSDDDNDDNDDNDDIDVDDDDDTFIMDLEFSESLLL